MPTEKGIATDYGVSRQVVREAARLLEDRGLVEIRAGRGMTVVAPNVDTIVQRFRMLLRRGEASFEQLMELRQMTEGDMAALAARNRSEEDLTRMRAMIAMAADSVDDVAACMDADMGFHMAELGRASCRERARRSAGTRAIGEADDRVWSQDRR